ncbi:MAG: SulP family inorganic anion transporter [Dehalococcoidia bacterium]
MSVLPILEWLPNYQRRFLRGDLVAGVSSWALVVPQAVAYGQIAGMPAQAGLAAAFAGPLGYAVLGTSRQLLVSPTSSSALISASVVGEMAGGDVSRFIALTAALAIITGVVLALLGLFRLGFVSQFLAYSVQTGFLFGLGLTILVTQLASVLGVTTSGGNFFPNARSLLENLGEVNGWTAVLGLGGLAVLLLMRRYAPAAPAALIVVLASIVLTAVLGLNDRGVDVVGEIPRGLPALALPDVSGTDILALIPAAIALAVIGYAESASVAQDFASRHHYDIDPDQELVALGGASALAGVFQGFLVAGGASQSVANDRAGAQTQLAGLIVAGLALVTAFALTFLFLDLPQAVLGAIVISAIVGFFRVGDLRRIAGLERESFAIALVALGGVLILGPLPGMILAIVLSVLILLSRTSRPGISALGRAPDGTAYGAIERHAGYQPVPGLLIIRQDGMLFFANARKLRQEVLAAASRSSPPCAVLLLDLEMSPDLDIQSADVLEDTRVELAGSGIDLWLGGVHARVREMLKRVGYGGAEGEDRMFSDVAGAVAAFEQRKPRGGVAGEGAVPALEGSNPVQPTKEAQP